MARKKIREFDAKNLIVNNLASYGYASLENQSILVTPENNLDELQQQNSWLSNTKLVCKPDLLFGKRKKHGLVLVNADFSAVKEFITNHINKETTIGKASDKLTHFLIEPFVEHEKEYYVAIVSERQKDIIYFSESGGIDVEENWDNIIKIEVPTLTDVESIDLTKIPENLQAFIISLYKLAVDLDFSYLEINPFAVDSQEKIHLLDCVAQLDSCAQFKQQRNWNSINFPKDFGKKQFAEEKYIQEIDQNSGASLKLTVLNPRGRIWNILAGGGASIIYLDMIANLGKGNEIANYGESSGNPSMQESYEYAKTILQLMMKEKDERGKILFILGGIANFTDVKETFKGFIKALEEFAPQLKEHNVSIYVRRGGPNYQAGLQHIKEVGEKLGLPMQVYGPETNMPKIIEIARDAL